MSWTAGPARILPASCVTSLMDILNIQSTASLYKAIAPEEARRIAEERLEIHPTTKHGSWLDMSEIELSALVCDLPELASERADLARHLASWTQRRNQAQVKANWQFTKTDARIKHRKLYPPSAGAHVKRGRENRGLMSFRIGYGWIQSFIRVLRNGKKPSPNAVLGAAIERFY